MLILNSGLWYNLNCTTTVSCNFKNPVQPLLDALKSGDEAALKVRERPQKVALGKPIDDVGGPIICKARMNVLGPDPPEVDYAKDLIRVARFVERHRSRLPAQVVWLDTTVQHFKGPGTYPYRLVQQTGDINAMKRIDVTGPDCQMPLTDEFLGWQNQIARRIWGEVSPSTLIVRTQELLATRPEDHSWLTKQDCTHWCQASSTFNEYVSTVLTAILVDGREKQLPWATA